MKNQERKICSMENYETKGLLFLIDETSYRKGFMVYACENAYLWSFSSSRVKTWRTREELERSFLSTNYPPLVISSWSRNLLARARAGHEGLREVFKLLPIPFPSLSLTPIKFWISYFSLPFLSKRSPIWVGREGILWPINRGRFRNPILIQTSYLMY